MGSKREAGSPSGSREDSAKKRTCDPRRVAGWRFYARVTAGALCLAYIVGYAYVRVDLAAYASAILYERWVSPERSVVAGYGHWDRTREAFFFLHLLLTAGVWLLVYREIRCMRRTIDALRQRDAASAESATEEVRG